MNLRLLLPWQAIILLGVVEHSLGYMYEYVMDDESVFIDCLDNPEGYPGMGGLFDLSNMTLEMGPDGIHVSGNTTSNWDIEPTDRIEARLAIVHLQRGIWQPTIYNMMSSDFCKCYVDPQQYWYELFPKHVINQEEAREKCFNYKGTVYYLRPYVLKMKVSVPMLLPNGQYRMIFNLFAFDVNNVRRPNGICFEMKGEFFKI
ncbi:uncharacterized protein LOC108108576 [Drosophila eugracilis]|uniref:uncharacterized protein LOC108108576 n=1 Tax=Drosophila eugracilis TaxID=29029 RepID=UPI0007E7A8B3|nr:uncharacterized protein LOC108108576 [Drosophila eugracilis]